MCSVTRWIDWVFLNLDIFYIENLLIIIKIEAKKAQNFWPNIKLTKKPKIAEDGLSFFRQIWSHWICDNSLMPIQSWPNNHDPIQVSIFTLLAPNVANKCCGVTVFNPTNSKIR